MKIEKIIEEILFLLFWAGLTVYYLTDNYLSSGKFQNQIFVLPIGIICLVLIIVIAAIIVKSHISSKPAEENQSKEKSQENISVIFKSMGLFCLYALLIEPLGFDVASFLFVLAMLLIQGERRVRVLVIFPLAFSFLASQFFYAFTYYEMPMFITLDIF